MDVLDRVKQGGRPPGVSPRPFQFTLRTMFLVTTVVAVVLGGLSVPEEWEWVRALTVFYVAVAIPIVAVTALVYGRGYVRTFALGALFPASAILGMVALIWLAAALNVPVTGNDIWQGLMPDVDPEKRRVLLMLGMAINTGSILLGGVIAVVVRRMVEPSTVDERHDRHDAVPATEHAAADADAPKEGGHE